MPTIKMRAVNFTDDRFFKALRTAHPNNTILSLIDSLSDKYDAVLEDGKTDITNGAPYYPEAAPSKFKNIMSRIWDHMTRSEQKLYFLLSTCKHLTYKLASALKGWARSRGPILQRITYTTVIDADGECRKALVALETLEPLHDALRILAEEAGEAARQQLEAAQDLLRARAEVAAGVVRPATSAVTEFRRNPETVLTTELHRTTTATPATTTVTP